MKSRHTRDSERRHSSARVKNRDTKLALPFGVGGPCKQLSECRSCPLLPLSPLDQTHYKLRQLNTQLAPVIGSASFPIKVDPHRAYSQAYRHTAKPSVRRGNQDDQLIIGLYQPGSHHLINLKRCWVQSPLINHLIKLIRQEASRVGIRGYEPGDEEEGRGDQSVLRYLVIRQGLSSDALSGLHETKSAELPALYLTLIVTHERRDQIQRLISQLTRRCPELAGVGVHQNTLSGNAIFNFDAPTHHLWGQHALALRVALSDNDSMPLALQVSATSFAQVNPLVAERAYRAVVSGLNPQPGDLALDLYCGVGVIGLMLASSARQHGGALKTLWGLEETPSSVADAQANAERLGFSEVRLICGRAEDELPRLTAHITSSRAAPRRSSSLIVALNPSRRGCQPRVLELIADLKPRRIAYMSCHARTLTRDLIRLIEYGYRVIEITLFDMFPGSHHYETVTILEPNNHESIISSPTERFESPKT